jgi:hypothetical protein
MIHQLCRRGESPGTGRTERRREVRVRKQIVTCDRWGLWLWWREHIVVGKWVLSALVPPLLIGSGVSRSRFLGDKSIIFDHVFDHVWLHLCGKLDRLDRLIRLRASSQ